MKKLVFLKLIILSHITLAQFPINVGTTNIDWFGQCSITTDNNLLLVGSTNYIGNGTSGDITLKKVDLNGNTLWNQMFAVGGSEDLASGLLATSDGGYIIYGAHTRTYAGAAFTGGTSYYSATYIIKVDPNGNQIWAKSIGGTSYGDNYGVSVVENSAGEYVCYGHVQHHSGCSSYATRILKLSASGNIIWSNCLQVNPDLVAGFTKIQGENNYVGAHNLSGTVVLRKYNDNGSVVNQINYQYQGVSTTSSKLVSNTSGEFYLLGTSNNKAVIAKFDNSLNLLWQTTILTPYNSRLTDLKQFGSNLILVGDIEVVDATNEYDFWLVKTTPSGQVISQYTHPSPGLDVNSRGSAIFQNDIFISGMISTTGYNQHAVKINLNTALCTNTTSEINLTSCDSFVSPDGQTYTVGGTYTAVIPNASGCDSTISINLTIKNSSSIAITANACQTYLAPDGQQYNSTGIYTAVIPNEVGCDSTITIDLTVNQPSSSFITEHSCGNYVAPDGQILSSSGLYTSVIPNVNGCDSTITIDLNVTNIDNTMTTDGLLLSANQLVAAYQWLDCNNANQEITGEQNQFLEVIQNGLYAVEISFDGCVDTSDCMLIDYVGLDDTESSSYTFYTLNDQLILKSGDINSNSYIQILDIQGKIVFADNLAQSLNISILNSGIYFLRISNPTGIIYNQRFMKYE